MLVDIFRKRLAYWLACSELKRRHHCCYGIYHIFVFISLILVERLLNTAMASTIKRGIFVFGSLVSFLHLVCAMVLFSSIIIWLSLEFTAPLPSALAFVVGIPCLLCSVMAILMLGVRRHNSIFGTIFLILAVVIIIAGVSILVPFALDYNHDQLDLLGEICVDCSYVGNRTIVCQDSCLDECCFTQYSAPLIRIFLASTIVALAVSLVAIFTGIAHLCWTLHNPERRKGQ